MKELIYHRILLPAIDRFSDKVGVVDGPHRATYELHGERVIRAANGLRDLGLSSTDRFAVMAFNSHKFLELQHAAFLGGGVINPLNLRLAGKELDTSSKTRDPRCSSSIRSSPSIVADALGDRQPYAPPS